MEEAQEVFHFLQLWRMTLGLESQIVRNLRINRILWLESIGAVNCALLGFSKGHQLWKEWLQRSQDQENNGQVWCRKHDVPHPCCDFPFVLLTKLFFKCILDFFWQTRDGNSFKVSENMSWTATALPFAKKCWLRIFTDIVSFGCHFFSFLCLPKCPLIAALLPWCCHPYTSSSHVSPVLFLLSCISA